MNRVTSQFKENRTLIVIIIFSFLLKLVLLVITRDMPLTNDPLDYYQKALAFIEKGVWTTTFRPPMHLFLMAIILYFFNKSIFIARLAQVLLSSLSVVVIHCIGKKIFNKKIGLLAAFIFSLYPTLVFYSQMLWTESLFILIFTSSIYFLLKYSDGKQKNNLVFAGTLWGFASLTKSMTVFFTPFVLLWLTIVEGKLTKGSVKDFSLFFLLICVVIAPWTYRNYLVYNHFIPITVGMGTILRTGNNFKSLFIPTEDCYSIDYTDGVPSLDGKNAYRTDKRLLKAALKFIDNNRLLFIKKCLWQASHLFTLDSFALRHLRRDIFGKVPLTIIRAVTILVVISYMAVVLLGTMGFISSKNDKNKWLFIMFIGYITLLQSITVSISRYRIPFVPFFIIYTSFASSSLSTVLKDIFHSYRLYIALLCITFLAISWYMSAPLIADMLATGGEIFHADYCFE